MTSTDSSSARVLPPPVAPPPFPRVISDWSDRVAAQLLESFSGEEVVALDVEGCHLSRLGNISIVQMATGSACYIFDILGKDMGHPLVAWLRDLLESDTVTKVVHDCRWDSDALCHHLDIRLRTVHDTACWQQAVCSTTQNASLNSVLEFYGLARNAGRDATVYERFEDFWGQRPLTMQMVEWASGDTRELLGVYSRQLDRASDAAALRAKRASDAYLEEARGAQVTTLRITNPGKFIGRRGLNVLGLQRRTNTLISKIGAKRTHMFMVFYHTEQDLLTVQREARRY